MGRTPKGSGISLNAGDITKIQKGIDEGNTNLMLGLGKALVLSPNEIKIRLNPATEKWCEHVIQGVREGSKFHLQLFGKVMGYVAPDSIIAVFGNVLGTDPDTALRAVALHKAVKDADDESTAAEAELFLRDYYRAKGKRLVILDEAGGSDAHVVSTLSESDDAG